MTAFDPPSPGVDLIATGLAGLASGVESEASLLPSIGAPRLRALGVPVERALPEPRHRLYERLRDANPDNAHSRYSGLIRRLVSFECGESLNSDHIARLMAGLGLTAQRRARVYFAGGATAVLLALRYTATDVELELDRFDYGLLRALVTFKHSFGLRVKLACPADVIPVPRGWERRSPLIARRDLVSFHHFDLYAQALAKVERGHDDDLADVDSLLRRGLIERARALKYFRRIEPDLYRFPAIDPPAFRRAVQAAFGSG